MVPVALVRAVFFVGIVFALIALTSAKLFKPFLQGDIGWRTTIGADSHGTDIDAAAEMGLHGDAFAAQPVNVFAVSVVRACGVSDTRSAVSAPSSIVTVAGGALGYKLLLARVSTSRYSADLAVRETGVVALASVRHRSE